MFQHQEGPDDQRRIEWLLWTVVRRNGVEYAEQDWGVFINVSKAQLHALDLGIGLAFQGEKGGP